MVVCLGRRFSPGAMPSVRFSPTLFFFEIKGTSTAISFKKKKQLYITSRSEHHHHNNTREQLTQQNSTPPQLGREGKEATKNCAVVANAVPQPEF
jgi:hypothetical protein